MTGGLSELKFRLLTEGVRVTDAARERWERELGAPLTLAEYATTNGIALELAGKQYVNAPIKSAQGIAELDVAGGYLVRHPELGGLTPVRPIPVAGWANRTLVDRMDGVVRPFSSFGVTHTDRCRVSPIAGCAWRCEFCDLPYELSYRRKHADDLLQVLHAAAADPLVPARHAMLSGGTPRRSDEAWMDDLIARVAERSPLPLEVMMAPRRSLDHPAWLRGTGVSGVSLNLEVWDRSRRRKLAPAKARYERRAFLEYVEAAVDAFGPGQVQSLVVFGGAIEPVESTLEGVAALVARGCVPVLSPFRPHAATPMREAPAATFAEAWQLYRAVVEVCEREGTGLRPGPRCKACLHNVAAVPDDSGFYV